MKFLITVTAESLDDLNAVCDAVLKLGCAFEIAGSADAFRELHPDAPKKNYDLYEFELGKHSEYDPLWWGYGDPKTVVRVMTLHRNSNYRKCFTNTKHWLEKNKVTNLKVADLVRVVASIQRRVWTNLSEPQRRQYQSIVKNWIDTGAVIIEWEYTK